MQRKALSAGEPFACKQERRTLVLAERRRSLGFIPGKQLLPIVAVTGKRDRNRIYVWRNDRQASLGSIDGRMALGNRRTADFGGRAVAEGRHEVQETIYVGKV